jgi:hypothetical protein
MKTTDLYSVSSGHEMKCGHAEPSNEESSFEAKSPFEFMYDLNKIEMNINLILNKMTQLN